MKLKVGLLSIPTFIKTMCPFKRNFAKPLIKVALILNGWVMELVTHITISRNAILMEETAQKERTQILETTKKPEVLNTQLHQMSLVLTPQSLQNVHFGPNEVNAWNAQTSWKNTAKNPATNVWVRLNISLFLGQGHLPRCPCLESPIRLFIIRSWRKQSNLAQNIEIRSD